MIKLRGVAPAAVSGVLAAAGGVGAGTLAGALLGGKSPAFSLGSRVIDLTPGWLKDLAVERLGTNDKPVLLGTIFAVMAILSAAVGVLASRRLRWGLIAAGLLNLVAVVASVKTTIGWDPSAAALLPGIVSLVVSVVLLWLFHRRQAAGDVADPAAQPAGFDRRVFMEAALASSAVAVIGGGTSTLVGQSGEASRATIRLPAAATRERPVPAGADLRIKGLAPFMTSNDSFYRIDVALRVPQIDAARWRLRIHGLVDREIELSFRDILAMPLTENRFTLTCVSNQVGDHYVGNATWLGVPTRTLLEQVGVSADADCLVSTAADDMTISTPVQALTDDRGSMLAIGMNGQPLPLKHGFPARMVVPGLYGYVSATKWITDMELTRFDKARTYWTQRGWAEQAPIKTASRIDVPRQFASVRPGTVQVAGVAYAQRRGVEKVQVRVDGGPWDTARLSVEDSIDTWRQWVYPWKATSGQHKLEVRATDRTGYTQTSRRVAPRPDGATGWHSVTVNVQ